MTDVQKQCLLRYLGYYTGNIDGIFGEKSKAAEAAFGQDRGLTGEEQTLEQALVAAVAESLQPQDFWKTIPNFTREEFRCRCGGAYCDGFPAEPSQTLVRLAQRVRQHFDSPAIISSGVRCETHNTKVGGVTGSRHLTGKAMDFTVRDQIALQVLDFVRAQPETCYAYAIDNCYIHMDVQ